MADVSKLTCIPLENIYDARERIKGAASQTPVVPLNVDQPPDRKIYLKLENLQPTGSFKLRGSTNAIRRLPPESLRDGVYTASAGNFAQGLAWSATQQGVPCTILVPESCPQTKLDAMERLGGKVMKVPFDTWWSVIQSHSYQGMKGHFIHPGCNADVIAGNGTIALEILEQLPDVDTVIVPVGSGGNACGIASVFKALKPNVTVYACEIKTAAPFSVSFDAGKPMPCDWKPSFVDGIGGKAVLPEMWNLVRNLLKGSVVVSLEETVNAIRTLMLRNHVVAEGAGAAAVAAALSGKAGTGNIVCVVSGGNIDADRLGAILKNEIPS